MYCKIIIQLILGFYFLNLSSTAVIRTTAHKTLQPRIIGGTPAKRGQFPYQVMIYRNGKKHCGGSILNENHIITAAHCVVKNGEKIDPSSLIVKGGDVNLLSDKIKQFPVADILVQEDFDSRTFDNDMAILRLAAPIQLEAGVFEAVTLASETVEDGAECNVSGWGIQRQNTTDMPDQLYYTDVQVINRKVCAVWYQLFNKVSKNMLCAGYENGSKDACEGDSGGPLMCGNKLTGIVSWGVGCGLSELPGVYTNIATQTFWIRSASKIEWK